MIYFSFDYRSENPAECAALDETIRAVCSSRTRVMRSSTNDRPRHCVYVEIGGPLDAAFHSDLAALLSNVAPLVHEFDPDGHWVLSRAPGKEISCEA